MEQSAFDWFEGRVKEQIVDIDPIAPVFGIRREISVVSNNLVETLYNGTTEEIISACARIAALSLVIADRVRFGPVE